MITKKLLILNNVSPFNELNFEWTREKIKKYLQRNKLVLV